TRDRGRPGDRGRRGVAGARWRAGPGRRRRRPCVTSPGTPFSIVCLSQSAWDAPLPTNRQQIMRRAAERGHEVLFVETSAFLGRKIGGRLAPNRRGGGVSTLPALNVAPRGHRYALPNTVNSVVTSAYVKRLAARLPQPVVLWIYDPFAAGMVGRSGERFAV